MVAMVATEDLTILVSDALAVLDALAVSDASVVLALVIASPIAGEEIAVVALDLELYLNSASATVVADSKSQTIANNY